MPTKEMARLLQSLIYLFSFLYLCPTVPVYQTGGLWLT